MINLDIIAAFFADFCASFSLLVHLCYFRQDMSPKDMRCHYGLEKRHRRGPVCVEWAVNPRQSQSQSGCMPGIRIGEVE